MPWRSASRPPCTTRVSQLDQSIRDEDAIAGLRVLGERRVARRHALGIAQGLAGRDAEGLAGHQAHGSSAGQRTGADLRALEVEQDRDRQAELGSDLAHQRDALAVFGVAAVREVQAHHVDAGAQQLAQRVAIGSCGSQRRNDLDRLRHCVRHRRVPSGA
jgi:hypothetical protein